MMWNGLVRTEREAILSFLKRCFDRAMKAGATTVNIADTVGYILPFEFSALIKEIRSSVENIEKAVSRSIATMIWVWLSPIQLRQLRVGQGKLNVL